MRTLIKSNGYNRMVEADPPAMPARKEEIGVVVDGFVVGGGGVVCADSTDEDESGDCRRSAAAGDDSAMVDVVNDYI
jgi:phage terminase large subunit-like protein